mgnify:CR=1
MASSYEIGDQVRIWGTFTSAGTGSDPTQVFLELATPANVVTLYGYGTAGTIIQKQGNGTYYADVVATQQGMWQYRWTGTGNIITSDMNHFYIKREGPF